RSTSPPRSTTWCPSPSVARTARPTAKGYAARAISARATASSSARRTSTPGGSHDAQRSAQRTTPAPANDPATLAAPSESLSPMEKDGGTCTECAEPVHIKKRGLCQRHYQRWWWGQKRAELGTCDCGAPAAILKTQECRRCH